MLSLMKYVFIVLLLLLPATAHCQSTGERMVPGVYTNNGATGQGWEPNSSTNPTFVGLLDQSNNAGYCLTSNGAGSTATFQPCGSGSGPFQSLTTTGSSGAATLTSGVLNIPNYTITTPIPVASGGSGCTGVRVITTGSSDTSQITDCGVAWNSATAAAKTENIPGCSSANASRMLSVKDEAFTANSYNISIMPATGTIENSSTGAKGLVDVISNSGTNRNYQCDGVSNWMVM